jgi:cofilin
MGRSKISSLTFMVTPDFKEIVIERRGQPGETWESLIRTFPADAPRYIATHYSWDLGADGKRSRTVFVHWCPSPSTLKSKMIYAATKISFKQSLTGLQVDLQAGDLSELTTERVLEQCQRFNKA